MNSKRDVIENFRSHLEREVLHSLPHNYDRNKKATQVNNEINKYREALIAEVKELAEVEAWNNEQVVNEIMLIQYASYVVMLESRNKVWKYEYMAFSRRIGELWEPLCKLPFYYPSKSLKIIEPPKFDEVQKIIENEALEYISSLGLSDDEKSRLINFYKTPWQMVDSGNIQLALDLHFQQDSVNYNCDFKSGFSSNEKGNTNRLLLVSSIYNLIGSHEKTLLFVRQKEDENNRYLIRLKESEFWDVYCAHDCYKAIEEFTGFDIRGWLDNNVDWEGDISNEFRKELKNGGLLKYLTW